MTKKSWLDVDTAEGITDEAESALDTDMDWIYSEPKKKWFSFIQKK